MPPIRSSDSNKIVCPTDEDGHLVCSSTHTLTLSIFLTFKCSRKNPALKQLCRKVVKQLVHFNFFFSFPPSTQPNSGFFSQRSHHRNSALALMWGQAQCRACDHVMFTMTDSSFIFLSSFPTRYVAHNKNISLPHLSPACWGHYTHFCPLYPCVYTLKKKVCFPKKVRLPPALLQLSHVH